MIEEYWKAMGILHKRSNYTGCDIERLKELLDDFLNVNETGNDVITNYINILSSGHVKYYM
jgi:hypothetical protein